MHDNGFKSIKKLMKSQEHEVSESIDKNENTISTSQYDNLIHVIERTLF